jgi:hypothetical protein
VLKNSFYYASITNNSDLMMWIVRVLRFVGRQLVLLLGPADMELALAGRDATSRPYLSSLVEL